MNWKLPPFSVTRPTEMGRMPAMGKPHLILLLALAAGGAFAAIPMETAAELAAFLGGGSPGTRDFAVTGRVSFAEADAFVLADGDSRVHVGWRGAPPPRGALVRAEGTARVPRGDPSAPFLLRGEPYAEASAVGVLSRDAPPPPERVALGDIDPNRHDLAFLETSGEIADAGPDEMDERYAVLILSDGGRTLPVFVPARPGFDAGSLVGAKVEAAGLFWKSLSGVRKFAGPVLAASSPDDVRIIAPPPDPFAAPEAEYLRYASPSDVWRAGRRTAHGLVVASWGRNKTLVRTADGRLLLAELSGGAKPPPCGTWVAVSGLLQADTLQMRLALASIREEPAPAATPAEPAAVPLSAVVLKSGGRVSYRAQYSGCPVFFEGRVVGSPDADGVPGMFLADADGLVVAVDLPVGADAPAGLAEGALVHVSGICVLESPAWSPGNVFPRVEGFRVVARGPEDLQVLRRAPWWTSRRLAAAALLLLAAFAAVLVWNRALERLASRRGRELLREQLGRERATLRVAERTRLAVELHDSLSQCLGGLACQLAAAKSLAGGGASGAGQCLDAAERMLQSSRTELQRCLFDLRGDALDEPDFSKAVARALAPVAGGAEVEVRLDVRRERMDDTVAHAAICIVRELVSNALRHGGAKHVAVSGGDRGGVLALEVRDDGRGFDPAARPGPESGHFGLEGVRERIRKLGGAFRIESSPGAGAAAFAELPLAGADGTTGERMK